MCGARICLQELCWNFDASGETNKTGSAVTDDMV